MTEKATKRAGKLEPDVSISPRKTVGILTEFIRTEVERAGFSRVVVGLSGGIDSTVSAYLAVAALGPASVIGVLMPYQTSSPDSLVDAEKVVGRLGILAEKIDITPIVDGFNTAVGKVGRVRLGNVLARSRMIVLFDRSAHHRALVLGTSNKTEIFLGYGTLHGDVASALNPLGDLYKTQIRRLAAYLKVPPSIRRKPPSADLWPDQSDEGELRLTYDEVDRLLSLLIDQRASRKDAIAAGFIRSLVDRVTRLVARSEFKRRLPRVARISTPTAGGEPPYPADWKT